MNKYKILLGIASMFALLWFVTPEALLSAVFRAKAHLVCIAYGLSMIEAACYATQLSYAVRVQSMDLGLFSAFKLQFSATFYGTIMPGDIGGTAAKWYKLGGKKGQGLEVAAVLLYLRMLNAILLFGVGLVGAAFASGPEHHELRIAFFLGFVLMFLLLVPLTCDRIGRRCSRWCKSVARKLFKNETALSWIDRLATSLTCFAKVPTLDFMIILLASIASIALSVFIVFYLCASMGVSVSYANILWFRAVVFCVRALPLTPGGIGVREGAVTALLPQISTAVASEAMAVSLLLLGRQLLWAFCGGLVEVFGWAHRSGGER